jgi:cold shock CspA family protein
MAYEAKVFRLLIASPSDVEEEREIAVKTIQEWNDLNSHERQVVLLPLRWETHTAPEYGKRPQEVINRQMVDYCDLVIGVFWTRIGSPTGVADSGTLEEIERVASQGKPVMLYFSQVKKDPNTIDLNQLKSLRDFKEKTFPKALVENYSTQVEFRDKLAKQIEIQLRNLIASLNSDNGLYIENESGSAKSSISLELYDVNIKKNIGQSTKLNSKFLNVNSIEGVPDFKESQNDENIKIKGRLSDRINTDYYREYVEYLVKSSMYLPINFWLKNNSVIGARDIYLDIIITSDINGLDIKSASAFEIKKPLKDKKSSFTISLDGLIDGETLQINENDERWNSSIEIRALQPKREVVSKQTILIGAEHSGSIDFQIRIYADTLAEPITQNLHVDLEVENIDIDAIELLKANDILVYSIVMDKGKVKFVNMEKGFGFITPDNGGDDVIFLFSQLEGFTLTDGDIVEYDSVKGAKGSIAANIRLAD